MVRYWRELMMAEKSKRFTETELALSRGVEALLELYYLKEKTVPAGKPLIDLTNKLFIFFKAIYGSDCKFEPHGNRLGIYIYDNKWTPLKFIDISRQQIEVFKSIMENLNDALGKKKYRHIVLAQVDDQIQTDIEHKTEHEDWIAKKGEPYTGVETEDDFYGPFPEELRKSLPLVDKVATSSIKHKIRYRKEFSDDYVVSATFTREFRVRPMTEFGNYLLIKGMDHGDVSRRLIPDPSASSNKIEISDLLNKIQYGAIVPLCTAPHLVSFLEIARSVLVHYHLAFDGFERIKPCEYCNKLYFEKRQGEKRFCSTKCRVNFNQQQEPEEKRKCRARQRAYYLRLSGVFNPVFKEECRTCLAIQKNGDCEFLKKKNTIK
jgi:hypothetical protein